MFLFGTEMFIGGNSFDFYSNLYINNDNLVSVLLSEKISYMKEYIYSEYGVSVDTSNEPVYSFNPWSSSCEGLSDEYSSLLILNALFTNKALFNVSSLSELDKLLRKGKIDRSLYCEMFDYIKSIGVLIYNVAIKELNIKFGYSFEKVSYRTSVNDFFDSARKVIEDLKSVDSEYSTLLNNFLVAFKFNLERKKYPLIANRVFESAQTSWGDFDSDDEIEEENEEEYNDMIELGIRFRDGFYNDDDILDVKQVLFNTANLHERYNLSYYDYQKYGIPEFDEEYENEISNYLDVIGCDDLIAINAKQVEKKKNMFK